MKNSAIVIRTGLGPAIGGTLFYVAAKYLPPMPYWDGFFRVLPAGLLLLAIRPGLPRGAWWWKSLVLLLAVEVVLLFWIRDSLVLNVLMLVCPVNAIRAWQTGG